MNNDKDFVIKRLKLIEIIWQDFGAEEKYERLKNINEDINKDIKKLIYIKENIIIYLKDTYQQIIQKLMEIIKNNQNKKISDYRGAKKGGNIHEFLTKEIKETNLEEMANKIKNVKHLLLFNIIYNMNPGKDGKTKFNKAYQELEEMGNLIRDNIDIIKLYEKYKKYFDEIRKKLSNSEDKEKKFIQDIKNYFNIKDENLIDGLTILFKIKRYELDINSIIFFFEYFEKNNDEWNSKLLPEKYKDLSKKEDFDGIKKCLKELKENDIYDYKSIKPYNKLFRCLYEKKEAIDFLFSKNIEDMKILEDRIQPNDRTINIKDIKDAEECIKVINRMKINLKNNFKIFKYIKGLKKETISKFENYSNNFSRVIELDRNDDISENVYKQVYNIIQNATFNINKNDENFSYYDENTKNRVSITMEELIHLKNKIHYENIKEDEDDGMKPKRKILIFFKNIISNIEIINEYMEVLRTKGSSLKIRIRIELQIKKNEQEPIVNYYLEGNQMDFKSIRDFLFNAKNKYIQQLNLMYKEVQNLRFLYGKQFCRFIEYLEENNKYNIKSFLRYILNNNDNKKDVEEGILGIKRNVITYIKQYELYNKNSLDGISDHINSLFRANKKTIEEHYDEIKIISDNNNIYKGLYLYGCENISMEEFILKSFWEKINNLPIAQNILITNKETSSEEIQAFFHRSILCNYNTLFMVEINDSFSNYQQSLMNNYIDQLLIYKSTKYMEETNKFVEKKDTKIYLDSCLVFVYEKNNRNISSFLNEMVKLDIRKFDDIYTDNKELSNSNLSNVKVITSDICGLGKSEKIKLETANKKYFHFPLGGILTKNIIFDKLQNLLDRIKDKDFKNVAVHLDLTESKEKSILNEFLFSFLITKFYTNNESIIYIPKDINIFIEIPNCFEDYLSNFSLLNIFNKDNITQKNMPDFNYSNDIIDIFDRMLDKKSNNKMIEKFVKSNIGISKYSFHQINIFINLFISQYKQFPTKLNFLKQGENKTKECIEKFAKCTKYFTYGGFAKLLTNGNNYDKNSKDYIDILSETYNNDLNNSDFYDPLIFILKNEKLYYELQLPTRYFSQYKNIPNDYLLGIKAILNLPNEVDRDVGDKKSLLSIINEKNNSYVMTNDNFKKMVLLLYRIKANVPVIIMGDTGCGKTALIMKLDQIINNGNTTVQIVNIHPGITDEKLCKKMEDINNIAKQQKYKELWVFFDEMNTCLSLSLLTEIFIKRTYNNKNLSENIRLIGACNPYRKRKKNTQKCGLSFSDDNDDERVYLVEPLPQSLLYYVFSFGSIEDSDEEKYISGILEKLFTEDEKDLHKRTSEAISLCHRYLRNTFDPSVVSLREIARFSKCMEFFKTYFYKKNSYEKSLNEKRISNEKNDKIRSIICSIYLCYYIRLTVDEIRINFEMKLRPILIKLINNGKYNDEKGGELLKQIENTDFKNELSERHETIENFSDFLKIEQEYILNQIDLDKGIGKNTLLKENVFLLFLSVNANIPYIIIGKPGSGKSLSAQLIYKSMKGIYSKNNFFKLFPRIIQTYFQGSESTQPEDVENLFEKAKKIYAHFKKKNKPEELPIIMVLFDEMGLAERSKSNPLKVLHSKLEYTGRDEGLSFVGISNYSLDAAKLNRALVSSVPDLDQKLDDLIDTAKDIAESISDKIKDDSIFDIISNTYFNYKNELQIIKELTVYKQFIAEQKKSQNNEKKKEKKDIDILKRNKSLTNTEITEIMNKDENNNELKIRDEADLVDEEMKKNLSEKLKQDEPINKKILSMIGAEKDDKSKDKETITESEDQIEDQGKEYKREKIPFSYIKKEKLFQNLLKKEKKIRKDFHGNRDFYNLVKGIAIELSRMEDSNDNDKVTIVIKYIERNFGGIDYEIDIDLNLSLEDIGKDIKIIKGILQDYNFYRENKKTKLSSVFLFKKLYNLECEKSNANNNLLIKKNELNDYHLNNCINENIKDTNSRYLLLEIKPSLTGLIYQKIKLQNPFKEIKLYDGSPFDNDNNKEYRFKKINEIQDDAKDDKLIIIENLDQIHPFLFDLYNMNYIIRDDKKFARICLEVFSEQLTLVNDNFRIIILVNRNFVDQCDLAFLNRLEKMVLSFNKLIDNQLKIISDNIIEEIQLKNHIKKYKNANYYLKNLLINSSDEEIQGLIYYYSQEQENINDKLSSEKLKEEIIDERKLKEKVFNKIYKVLPQDIISILPDDHIIKKKYYELKKTLNFKEYINDEENLKYKISIIYTFTNITNSVEGLDQFMSIMVSQIKSENDLKNSINELKIKNEDNIKIQNYIFIEFEQNNYEKIKFITNYILNNLKEDNYSYIMIMHINRNFNIKNKNNNQKIYSLPDINNDINQLFIDNLNGIDLRLNDLLTKDILKI